MTWRKKEGDKKIGILFDRGRKEVRASLIPNRSEPDFGPPRAGPESDYLVQELAGANPHRGLVGSQQKDAKDPNTGNCKPRSVMGHNYS